MNPISCGVSICLAIAMVFRAMRSFIKHLLNIDFRCSELFRPRLVPALNLIGEVAAPRNGFFTFVLDEKKHSGKQLRRLENLRQREGPHRQVLASGF